MEYTNEDCIRDTQKHISQVQSLMGKIIDNLEWRLVVHDQSKLHSPELEVFTEFTPKLKSSTYGSEEYKEYLKGMKVALDHHYANNPHHPEHFSNGIRGMNLMDIVEMFCDWKAASMRHDNGDINKSIEINKNRFNMSEDLVEIFKNTVKFFD